ncbi:phosphoesterase [Bifidobacterium callitrichos]|uniref:Phosphoesterase n=2 Tax=Bifidobacterium callitrichos TaxID=762209 RepID=A0A2T3GA50_9BIFI|nr:phosphoesterase [Bifidobacterium callitrichos]
MTDEQKPSDPSGPVIRDPREPRLMPQSPSGTSSRASSDLVRDFEPLDIPVRSSSKPAYPSSNRPTSLADVADVESTNTMDLTAVMDAATGASMGAPAGAKASSSGEDDPLSRSPRASSRVLCVLLGLMFIAAAFGVWWLGTHTEAGQAFDDMTEVAFADTAPAWLGGLLALGTHLNVVIVSTALAVLAVVIAAIRRRWWLLGQIVVFGLLCFAATLMKPVLPRPFIIHTEIVDGPSAPSGHVTLAVASAIALLLVVSRGWRWVVSLVGMTWSAFVGLSVVYGRWHRPSDAAMAMLLVGGIALIVLAFTRASGMDRMGTRRSSAGVQIVASVSLTAGIMATLYGAYVVWQIVPGLTMSAQWARSSSMAASAILAVAIVLLVFGCTLMMRQITASPLSRLGLVGAPPAPPKRRREPSGHAS